MSEIEEECFREFWRVTERRMTRQERLNFWEKLAGINPLRLLPCGMFTRGEVE